VGVIVKTFIHLYNKQVPCNIPLACILVPFPPFLAFRIHIENNIIKFGQLINNSMQREIMFHLNDPYRGVKTIKFIDLNSRKTGVMMKGVGLKSYRMGGINTI